MFRNGFKFKPKNKEAVPNVVIAKSSISKHWRLTPYEQTLNKQGIVVRQPQYCNEQTARHCNEQTALFESSGLTSLLQSCCQQTFQKKPLEAKCFVMARLGFKFKPKNKNKNKEAVPNVVIAKPSIS